MTFCGKTFDMIGQTFARSNGIDIETGPDTKYFILLNGIISHAQSCFCVYF